MSDTEDLPITLVGTFDDDGTFAAYVLGGPAEIDMDVLERHLHAQLKKGKPEPSDLSVRWNGEIRWQDRG